MNSLPSDAESEGPPGPSDSEQPAARGPEQAQGPGDQNEAKERAAEAAEKSGGVKFTDKRRFDPETGKLRTPPASATASVDDVLNSIEDQTVGAFSADARVRELTDDVQRVTAEYANYRKRVDRDRDAVRELAVLAVLKELLPVLDDIERARAHGELTGPFKAVADALAAKLEKLGLEPFGKEGEPFDPTQHEALTHSEGEGLEAPTVSNVFQPGYMYKGRVVRPAGVAVTE